MKSPETKRLLSIAETTRLLGLGRSTVYGLIKDGQLDSLKIGKRRLVPEEAINTFIAQVKAEA